MNLSKHNQANNLLFIYKKQQLVGYLSFEKGQHQFVYDNHYLSKKAAKPVSFDLPLTSMVFMSERMFNVFEQVIPEGQDRKLLEKQAASVNDFDLLPFLKDIYGDLLFSKTLLQFDDNADSFHYVNVKAEILGDYEFINVLEQELKIDNETLFPPNNHYLKHFRPSGLSGFQHKLSVVMDDKCIRQAKHNEASHYFIKPYHLSRANPESEYYLPHLAINEHLFMSFAKNELGFDVPWNGIIKKSSDCEYHYIVKRYDRYKGYKFAFEEFASLVGLNSETKYQISSEHLFKTIKKFLTLKSERLILLKYYFYSMLIAHEDMHNEASHYFIKPYHLSRANPESEYYLPHLAINEHLFMSFAKNELGFDVPWNGIIKKSSDCEYHYIVKRYDRYKGYKFAFEEFASLVGLNSETKYQISSEHLFKTIKKYLRLKSERLILLKYYFYSMLIAHEDMHTKNLSVLTEAKTLYMSPLYDIATTAIYQGSNSCETALLINGKNKNIRPQDFYVLVDLLEVNRQDFDTEVSKILLKYIQKLPEYFEKLEKLSNIIFYERSRNNSAGRKPRFTKSILFADRFRRKHQARMLQLEKGGWYKYL